MSVAHVRTAYGLPGPVHLMNSVKQGDPLAGYVYIMCLDGLYDSMPSNLPNGDACGYPWPSESIQTTSMGYADDVAILSNSFEGLHHMHSWVTEFFYVHRLVLNSDKTIGIHIGFDHMISESIDTVSFMVGPSTINFSSSKKFRYLGLMYTPDLDWEDHFSDFERRRILPIWRRLRSGDFTVEESISVYREVVVSTVDSTTRHIPIPTNYLQRWDSLFYGVLNELFLQHTQE